MDQSTSGNPTSLTRLVLVPGLITLAVTILRVAGELLHWAKPWFDSGSAIVGITWLVPIFGIYFGVELARRGQGPASLGRAIGLAFLGMVVLFGGFFLVWNLLKIGFYGQLIVLWSLGALAAALQLPGWPALFKTLLAYGYTARIPVAIVMLLAMLGNWGTHYDYVPERFASLGFWARYLWFAFFAQMVFWVGFTIVVGAFFAVIAAAIARGFKRAAQPGS